MLVILTVEGPNACGKTTFINKFKSVSPLPVEIISVKTHGNMSKALLNNVVKRNTFNFNNLYLVGMINAHLELLNYAMENNRDDKIILLDRSIPSNYVYQYYMSNTPQLNLQAYNMWLDPMSNVAYMVYINPGVDVLKERLLKRADADHLVKDIDDIQAGYDEYFTKIRIPDIEIQDSMDVYPVFKRLGISCKELTDAVS